MSASDRYLKGAGAIFLQRERHRYRRGVATRAFRVNCVTELCGNRPVATSRRQVLRDPRLDRAIESRDRRAAR